MNDKTLVKLLAVLVLMASLAAAFFLGVISYTIAKGALPFGIHFMPDLKKEAEKAAAEAAKGDQKGKDEGKSELRVDEDVLSSFANDLKAEREKIARERDAIEERRKNAEIIMKQAIAMQAKVEAKEKEVDELLKKVDKREMQNVADLQKLVAGMETASACTMLLAMDETLAARILYSMNKKVASLVVAEGMKGKANKDKIMRITDKMQTLSDELKKGADTK